MALPPAAAGRRLKHRRSIDVQVHARGDGLWEVDAHLSDTKTRDMLLAGQTRPAGEPIHDMLLRLIVDEQFNIVDAGSQTLAVPYPGHCETSGDAYRGLIGLNLLRGFRLAAAERLGGVQGCTHLTELAQLLPTAVVQGFAGEASVPEKTTRDGRPFQIDRCHALRSEGDVVRVHYPRWYRQPEISGT